MAESKDSDYMQRCLQLALLGAGNVAPNPMVGAVLVYENRILGEGFHQQYGKAHAEVNCILHAEMNAASRALVPRSTLYVSLEPCAHFGKTPPCADLIIDKKIPKVIIGCNDPFKQVDGKGIEKLRNAGVDVQVGVLEAECSDLNKRFFSFHLKQRPFVLLKWAQTANGKIAGMDGVRMKISNEVTNRLVHKWRSEEAAIMVGTTTALTDNPSLTNRLWTGKDPLRIVIDRDLRLPRSLFLFNDGNKTIVFNLLKHEEMAQCGYYQLNRELPFIDQVLTALFHLNIQSVMVEGGARVLQNFIDKNLWDEARVITNNALQVPSGVQAPSLAHAVLTSTRNIYEDTVRYYKPAKTHAG
ncbi:MAG: bifunctional diaminohydroxyphosphoribosylaminopyrimidine deaminase/5-amino-6-(5-phosphoribosylamino)uracil reductase RibD [Chitinophagaceae bacterium]